MKSFLTFAVIATLFSSTFLYTGCATTKRDAILEQLDAVSGATKKISNR